MKSPAAAAAVLLLAACGGDARPDVTGTWQEQIGARRLWEFRADGTAEMRTEDGAFSAPGTWSWKDGRLHVEIRGQNWSNRGTYEVRIQGNRMTLTEGSLSVDLLRK